MREHRRAVAAGSARTSQGGMDQAGFVLSVRPPGLAAAIVPEGNRDAETENHTNLLLTVTLGLGLSRGFLCVLCQPRDGVGAALGNGRQE